VWTGRRLFAFGGRGALFDPASDRWSRSRPAPLDRLSQPVAVRDGRMVILAGLALGRLEAAAYRPATNTWARIDPPAPPSHLPQSLSMVTTDDGVLLWSLWAGGHGHFPGYGSGVDVYRLGRSGTWANVTGAWPQSQTVNDPVFTGRKVLLPPGQIWCGLCPHPAPFGSHGYIVDPRTLHRTPIPHGPLDDLGPQILWTGSVEISLNATGETIGPSVRVLPGDTAFWNPRTRRWRRGPRAPRPLSQAPAVWTGHELLALARDGAVLRYG
jgi:hypothetical protein